MPKTADRVVSDVWIGRLMGMEINESHDASAARGAASKQGCLVGEDGREVTEREAAAMFEPSSWDERYSREEKIWSGNPNAQLVAEVSGLIAGSALDVGCGEGGDVIWLARQGWRVTGADFSANGLDRAARYAEQAGVAEATDWWQVDARSFAAAGRSYDLVTTHFLHPPDGGMVNVTRRLAQAVAPGGASVGRRPRAV